MNPRLVAISGPFQGSTLPLERQRFTIGRHDGNDLQVLQLGVSRRHCEIHRDGDRFLLRDLDSRQGTFVNTLAVRERRLEHSDLVQVGDTSLLFLLDAGSEDDAGEESFGSELVGHTTVFKRPEEAFYLQPDKVSAALPAAGRTARGQTAQARIAADLNALLEISTAVQDLRGVDELAECLVERLLDVLPAERGCLLLLEPGDEEPTVVVSRDRRRPDKAPVRAGQFRVSPFRVSRTILSRVLGEKVALLCRDVEQEDGLREAESVRAANLRSVLCVPLVSRERLSGSRQIGALYFDTSLTSACPSRGRPGHSISIPATPTPSRSIISRCSPPPPASPRWRWRTLVTSSGCGVRTAGSRPRRSTTAWWGRARR